MYGAREAQNGPLPKRLGMVNLAISVKSHNSGTIPREDPEFIDWEPVETTRQTPLGEKI